MKVVSINQSTNCYREEVVSVVKDLLRRAEAGEIKGLAFVAHLQNTDIGSAYCGSIRDEPFTAVGGIEDLKDRVKLELIER